MIVDVICRSKGDGRRESCKWEYGLSRRLFQERLQPSTEIEIKPEELISPRN